jgi:hypothetical protein
VHFCCKKDTWSPDQDPEAFGLCQIKENRLPGKYRSKTQRKEAEKREEPTVLFFVCVQTPVKFQYDKTSNIPF